MSVSLRVPKDLRRYCGGHAAVELAGGSVGELLRDLAGQFAELAHRVLDEDGQLRSHLVVIRNDQVLPRDGLASASVAEGDDLRIYVAVSGG